MKLYTRTGDGGETGLFGGKRVLKTNTRIQAIGAMDELNSALGMMRAQIESELTDTVPADDIAKYNEIIHTIQSDLFTIGSNLATPPLSQGEQVNSVVPALRENSITWQEELIDVWTADLPKLNNFILPGGSQAGAHTHWARTICRSTERNLLALHHEVAVEEIYLQYINRLSDLLFTLARRVNQQAGVEEHPWIN